MPARRLHLSDQARTTLDSSPRPPRSSHLFTFSPLLSAMHPTSRLHSQYICWGPKSQPQLPRPLKASEHCCPLPLITPTHPEWLSYWTSPSPRVLTAPWLQD